MSHAKTERRRWRRIPVSVLGNLSVSIVGGPDARLINLSRGGAQLEVGARLPLRSFVRLKLTRPDGDDIQAGGRVAWAKVAAIVSGQVIYRVAIVFDELIPDLAPGGQQEEHSPPALESPGATDAVPDNLARFPLPAAEPAGDSAPADTSAEPEQPHNWDDITTHDLRVQLAAATENLARQSAVSEALTTKLKESYARVAGLRTEWDSERRRLQEERATLAQQLTDALTRGDTLQATLEARDQEQAQAIREQQDRYETLISELVRATNDQQTEYQRLLEQLTAAQDEQRRRAQGYEAELAKLRSDAEHEREKSESRRLEIQARLDAAEALCAAHGARYEELRQAAGKLADMLASPVRTGSSTPGSAAITREPDARNPQAVA